MRDKPDHFYNQSAVIAYRFQQGRPEILLVTSRSGKRWVIPKGIIEPELSAAASAAKEALEEAGVEGRIGAEPLGSYHYEKWGDTCSVQVFLLAVERIHDEWAEAHRRRVWVSPTEAAHRVEEEGLKRLLLGLSPDLAGPGQEAGHELA